MRFLCRQGPIGAFAAFGVLGLLAGWGCSSNGAQTAGSEGAGGGAATTTTGSSGTTTVTALFDVPASLSTLNEAHFFDQPWPSDLRLENGAPVLAGYYNPRSEILGTYIDAMKGVLDGFSPAGAGYVRFDGPLDKSTLPGNPKDGLDPGASVQLIDVDPASPEKGSRKLISLEWRRDAGVYWLADTLAFMPTYGFPLRPHTQYAFVMTNKVHGEGGAGVRPSADLEAVLGLTTGNADTTAAKATFAPALAAVEAAGITKESIVQMTVFTTADPTAELFAVRDNVSTAVAAPTADPAQWALHQSTAAFDEYLGNYGPSPNYQQGTTPYFNYGDGGNFLVQNGVPVLHDTFNLRFSLMVPNATACPVPLGGYPIVLYAHGTGGDYRSYTRDGSGASLAAKCVATMGIDQIFHGTRPGAPDPSETPTQIETDEELRFFNFNNVDAARTNGREAAIDEVQRSRLFTETHMVVPASISKTGVDIGFDASKLMFFGHSQGGLNGPLYLAADPSARGGVLSGSGAIISIALLEKTLPAPSVAALVKSLFLALDANEAAEVDAFHPAISLAQSIVDATDPIHYARYLATSPRAGTLPKSIYMTEGVNPDGTGDSYAPPHGIEAHGIAAGLPLQLPNQHDIVELGWGGPTPITIPSGGLSGNLGGGLASGVLAQWQPNGSDGHFVVFDVPAAQEQAAQFIQNLGGDPVGRVPQP